jgi:hypothetical protein
MIAPCERSETRGKKRARFQTTLNGSNKGREIFDPVRVADGLELVTPGCIALLFTGGYHYLTPSAFSWF